MKTTKLFASMFMAMAVAFSACTNVNDPEEEDLSNKLPFSETFEAGLGKFTTQSVSGDELWKHEAQYKYVMITGYVDQTNKANEDWLISPEIDLTDVTAAKLSFEHVTRYFASVATEATVWVSENYVDGLPSTATWTQLTTPAFSNAANWNLVPSGEISLTAFAGKKIKIAFKYISTATKAGTWEVKNFLVEEGEAENEDPGTGEVGDTLTVAQALVTQNSEVKWVKGYIVGSVKADETISAIDAADDVLFSATGVRNTMVLLADSKTETDYTKCVAVNLPTGEIRTAVNLVDNPSNLGKLLKVNGTLRAYFGIPGVRDLVGFKLEGYVAPTGDFAVPEMSIADVRAQWAGEKKTLTDKKKIVGIVVTDLVGGNSGSLKNLTIVSADNSAGIMVRLTENNTYNMGDKIEIALEGLELNQYGLAIQLNNVPTVKTQRIATNQTVTPVATTIANVRSNYASFESRLVTVTGTITSGGEGKWYSGTASGQNNKLTSGADELIMYVTKYATFKDSAVPTGEKTVTGIVGQYSTATATSYQLIIRNLDDVK
ncbi:MAG: DUF6359 domain-containing protein [Paludibacter sp.]|jgi:hypothetical protein|nr:DUF6359 domain-containing protein [Paludibacter sp.]MDD3488608.1 DUF6359 domain-containing protein [Paludibacter sp.]